MSIIQRLRNPPLGTETSERNLMTQAATEIERLRALLSGAESCRKDAERMREALTMIATTSIEDGCTCDNGYTPMWVAKWALVPEDNP